MLPNKYFKFSTVASDNFRSQIQNVEKLEQQGLQHKNLVTGQAWLTQGRRSRRV